MCILLGKCITDEGTNISVDVRVELMVMLIRWVVVEPWR